MARNKKVEMLSNDQEVLHPMTDGDCVIFTDGQTLTQKLSEDDSVKYTPEIVNSSPMFKVGEGNSVDYSANVLDGAYERATLQGQTYVNYIQESSADEITLPTPFTEYERTQHNTLTSDEEGTLGINLVGQSYVNALQHDSEEEYVVLGESLEFQEKKVEYTSEGQIKSAMLKGQTLVNLDSNGSTVGTLSGWSKENGYYIINKPTDKTCGLTFTKRGGDFTQGEKILIVVDNQGDYLNLYGRQNYYGVNISFPQGLTKCVFTIQDNSVPGLVIGRLDTIEANIKFRTMLIEYQEGMENWDIPYFEDMQSVTVSTKLENKLGTFSGTASTSKTGKTFTTTDGVSRSLYLYTTATASTNPINLKPKTKYLIQFTISNLVLDGLSRVNLIWSDSTLASGNCLFGENTSVEISANGTYRTILSTTDLITTSSFVIKGYSGDWENSGSSLRSLTISNIMCIEYQNGMENWDLPYFEDYQVMKPVQVESVNRNLTYLINNYIDDSTGIASTTTVDQSHKISHDLVPCTSTTLPLIFYGETPVKIEKEGRWFFYDANKKYIDSRLNSDIINNRVTIPENTRYTRVRVPNAYTDKFMMLEYNDIIPTSYIPHQSKTTYSWDEVILRKIGDVEDTLDLTTGEWVQRIGEIVLDGSETWVKHSTKTNVSFYYCYIDNLYGENWFLGNIINDKLQQVILGSSITSESWQDNKITEVGSYFQPGHSGIGLFKNVATVSELQQYLQQNPITVQYKLETPIIHKVNLSRPNLQVYDDITHVHTKCLDGTLIPNIYLPSDISYPAILEPSTTYNVCVNQTEVSADNPLTVNVGGTSLELTNSRMTITTPETLTTDTVSFTGKDNKIKEAMLIKNSSLLTGDLPHFNGIGSVQLGKTIENLCDSTDSMYGGCVATKTVYNDHVSVTVTKTGSLVICSSLIRPLENGKKYFVYAPNTFPTANACHVGFYNYYNDTYNFGHQVKSVQTGKCIIEIDQKDKLYTMITLGYHSYLPIGTYTINKPIICEYEPGMENWDWESIGYFTGTKNIGNEFMKVQNKNLLTENFTCCTLNTSLDTWYILYHNELEIQGRSRAYSGFYKLKPGATYTVSSKDNTLNLAVHFGFPNKPMTYDSGWQRKQSFTFTNTENYEIMSVYVAKRDDSLWAGSAEIANLINIVQLEESSTATTYTAHKHNELYITKDQPIDLTWEQGRINPSGVGDSYTNAINNAVSYGVRNKGLLNLKPNTTYRVSLGDKTNFKYHIAVFDNSDNALSAASSLSLSGDWVSSKDTIFTTTKDAHKIGINVQKQDSSSITPSEINHVKLEEVTDVVLRGVGSVHDELDITRGIYTQRIGEIVLNGNESTWGWIDSSKKAYTTSVSNKIKLNSYMSCIIQCDKYPCDSWNNALGGAGKQLILGVHSNGNIEILCGSICTTLSEWLTHLKSNPITVQYILETPIIHKVHIGNKNESNNEVAKPNDVFTLPTLYAEQTHIDMTNNGLMPKVQSRDYIAYPISPMINRTYTLFHNNVGSNDLAIDLLGRTQTLPYSTHKGLVYTPTTMDEILHNELRISGANNKISHVMYIDGGYMDREIPYIEGMKNAVNPIVKNIGKNLFDYDSYPLTYDGEYYMGTCRNLMSHSTPCYGKTVVILGRGYTDSTAKQPRLHIYYTDGTNEVVKYISSTDRNNPTEFRKITLKPVNYISIRYHTNGIVYLKDIYVGIENTNHEPYKENICYVDCGEIRLTQDMFEQGSVGASSVGSHYNSDKTGSSYRIRTKELIKLEMGEQYVFLSNNEKYKYSARFYDMNGNKVSHSTTYDLSWKGTTPFTILNDAPMCAFFIAKMDDTGITVDDVDTFDFQLVKVSEIKPLRSLPNGVCDEIDLETGKYIQRVGEVVLDGSEVWGLNNTNSKTTCYHLAKSHNSQLLSNMKFNTSSMLCNRYAQETQQGSMHLSNNEGIFALSSYNSIYIVSNIMSTNGANDFKQYLSENPITVQYELAEPIVKDIVIHNYPHSYEGGHVIIENGDPNTPIPAQIKYRAVTNRSGQIQQHTEQVEKQDREINELEILILGNIHLSQTR